MRLERPATRPSILAVPILLFLLCAFLAEPVEAQRRSSRTGRSSSTEKAPRATTPLEEARAMRKDRRSARQIAGVLERRWRQGPVEAAKTLREAGFSSGNVADAFRGDRRVTSAELPGLLVAAGLETSAAITAARARSFQDPVFGTVDLDCVGPNGLPVPCGIQGGDGSPAMGALSWSPHEEGTFDGVLTIESTNIPTVSVQIGGETLELLEATSTRIRARFPSRPTTGDLVLVRQSDGKIGLVESNYRVVAPPPPTPAEGWFRWAKVARDAAVQEARAWVSRAKIEESRCRVVGPNALAEPGVLTSDYRFQGRIRSALRAAGAPREVAEGWQRAFEEAWMKWAENVTIPGLPFYPAFAAFAGEKAPAMENVPFPLVTLTSTQLNAMTPTSLGDRIDDEIGGSGGPVRATAIGEFSTAIGTGFGQFLASTMVVHVLGKGAVPTYDPTAVPPVTEGSVEGTCYTNTGFLDTSQFSNWFPSLDDLLSP